VVSADQPIVAIVNLQSSGPSTGESYDGVNAPGVTANIPLFQQGNAGYDTTLHIQNTDTTVGDANNMVTVTFKGSGAPAPLTFSLPPSGSIAVDRSNDQIIVPKFVGSVVVSGTQPIAVESNQTNSTILFASTGSASGSTSVFAPLLMSNNGGFSTGFQVQNTGAVTTTLTLTVSQTGSSSTFATDTAVVGPGQSKTWYPIPGTTLPGAKFVGSGIVTSDNNMPLLGVVNELSIGGQGMAYNAFGSGAQSVQMPLIMFNNSGFYTGEQVQNVGSTDATVDLLINGIVVDTQVIGHGNAFTWFNTNNPAIYGNQKVSSGVAKGRSPTDQLVGIVNETTLPQQGGDTSFAYEGFAPVP